ncbi:MAG TPA: hypothetical protein DCL35_03770 [Candidatus Omnitrophica bacterium]|nr:hypothetical protein [Candidatus Omnitrophota bacterium]
MNLRSSNDGVTLIELILAMVLVGAIIMTGLSMELGLRRIYSSTDFEVHLLDEAAPIMAMVTKDINRGVGAVATAQSPFSGTYRIYYDSNFNGMRDAADTAVEYQYNSATYNLNYRRTLSGPWQLLSDKVTSFSIAAPVNGVSTFSISLKRSPSLGTGYTNPQIAVTSSAQYRGYSIN